MKEAMKHRLVGTAVLVAFGILAWTVVFDTSPVREINLRSQIPGAPPVDRFDVPDPAPVALPPAPDSEAARAAEQGPPEGAQVVAPVPDPVASPAPAPEPKPAAPAQKPAAPVAKPAPAPAKPAPRAAPPEKTPPPVSGDRYGLPEQWAMQLGVFSAQDRAKDVRAKAEKAGYHAILQSVDKGGTRQYRVLIEPRLDRRAVERLAPEVERKLGIKGYVTRYYPQ